MLRGPGVVHPGGNAGGLDKEGTVALILLILILAILLAGLGFAIHLLWWIALIVAVVWLLGFVFRSGERTRWYRW